MKSVKDGSIYPYKKGHRGVLQVPGPFGVTKPKYFKGTDKRKVRAKMNAFLDKFEKSHGSTMTVAGCCEAFIERFSQKVELGQRSGNTLRNYKAYQERFIKPELGRVKVADLKAADVETFLEMVPGKQQRNLVRSFLRGAIKAIAMKQGVTRVNMAGLSDPVGYRPPMRRVPTVDEARSVIACADEPFATLFAFGAAVGLRPHKEAKEVTWNELQERKDGMWLCLRDSKTEKGKQPIPIPKAMAETLRKHPRSLSVYLFPNPKTGKPFNQTWICEQWHKARIKAKAPYSTPGLLRHLRASELAFKGTDRKTLSELMRHTDVRTTEQYYVSVRDEVLRKAVEDE